MPVPPDPLDRARLQRTLQHLAVSPIAAVLLGLDGGLGPVAGEQLGASVLAAVATWLVRNQDKPGRRYLQTLVPVGAALATALIPLTASGASLAGLSGVAGAVPLLHLLAALGNAVTRTPAPPSAVATGEHEQAVADVAAPPVARTGGEAQRAVSTDTTLLRALSAGDIARMDAERAGSTAAPPPAPQPSTSAPKPSADPWGGIK